MSSVSVKTTEDSGIIRSILTITNADPKDAGNYTCKPSNAIAASIQVFVSEGKYGKMPRTPAPVRLWWVMLHVHEFGQKKYHLYILYAKVRVLGIT